MALTIHCTQVSNAVIGQRQIALVLPNATCIFNRKVSPFSSLFIQTELGDQKDRWTYFAELVPLLRTTDMMLH
jgi:hypothetical protein